MAVFTNITQEQLSDWISGMSLGHLVSFKGIATGIENSNFFVTLESEGIQTEYVLTIFEVLNAEQLPFYLGLMNHLAQKGLPVPEPYPSNDGQLFRLLAGKPAALVCKLPGSEVKFPTVAHCRSVGDILARMHNAVDDFTIHQNNLRGLDWWLSVQDKVNELVPQHLGELVTQEIKAQFEFSQTSLYRSLPTGACHCDLFFDNVLFSSVDRPSVIDFYFAGVDRFLFDLAVTANDWCIDRTDGTASGGDGAFLTEHLQALLDAYHQVRPLTEQDKQAWPMMTRAAALRFWCSRLIDFYQTREAALLSPKDPSLFEVILQKRQQLQTSTMTWVD